MAEKLTFLHAADLHLGAPLRGLRALSPKWADRVSQAIPAAFDTLVETALQRNVDFCVFAGDIFDQAQPSYANYLRFASGLKRLAEAGIPSYLCTGNHDPYTSWRSDLVDMPEQAFMFPADKPGFTVFERGGRPLALLGGRGFFNQVFNDSEQIAEGITRVAAEQACGTTAPFAVGVIHSGLNLDPFKAPANPADLLKSGMDYWALGHIHQPWQDSQDNPRIVFPGCIQGRDIKEVGPRGCCVVTLEEGRPNIVEFVPLASVVWQLLEVDISSCATLAEAQAAVMKRLFDVNGSAQCDYMVARIMLVGQTELHILLQERGMLEDLREQINMAHPNFFCDSIRDATVAPLNIEALANEGLFPAVLLQSAQELEGVQEDTLQFLQREFVAKDVALPHALVQNLEGLQEEARNLALDMLHCGVSV